MDPDRNQRERLYRGRFLEAVGRGLASCPVGNECRSKHQTRHENELARVLLVREGEELPRWTDWIVNTLA